MKWGKGWERERDFARNKEGDSPPPLSSINSWLVCECGVLSLNRFTSSFYRYDTRERVSCLKADQLRLFCVTLVFIKRVRWRKASVRLKRMATKQYNSVCGVIFYSYVRHVTLWDNFLHKFALWNSHAKNKLHQTQHHRHFLLNFIACYHPSYFHILLSLPQIHIGCRLVFKSGWRFM